jgi:hypothetical protein
MYVWRRHSSFSGIADIDGIIASYSPAMVSRLMELLG